MIPSINWLGLHIASESRVRCFPLAFIQFWWLNLSVAWDTNNGLAQAWDEYRAQGDWKGCVWKEMRRNDYAIVVEWCRMKSEHMSVALTTRLWRHHRAFRDHSISNLRTRKERSQSIGINHHGIDATNVLSKFIRMVTAQSRLRDHR